MVHLYLYFSLPFSLNQHTYFYQGVVRMDFQGIKTHGLNGEPFTCLQINGPPDAAGGQGRTPVPTKGILRFAYKYPFGMSG